MIYKGLLEGIRHNLDDVSETRFSDRHIHLTINQAYRHIYRELIRHNIFTHTGSITVSFVAGIQETVLPDDTIGDFQKAIIVLDEANNPIDILEEEISKRSNNRSFYIKQADSPRPTSQPDVIGSYSRFLYLGFDVVPTSSFDVTLVYAKVCSQFKDSPDSNSYNNIIPPEHHDVIILYCTLMLLGVHKDADNFWAAMYREHFESMMESINLKPEVPQGVIDVCY